MAKSTVAVRFTGDTANLKRSLNDVDGGFGKMSKAVKVGMAAAGTAVVAFAGTSIKAYVEAEKAQAQLTAAFEKFPQLAGANADALRELNSELAKKTQFDDDATASGQAVLAQFGLTADELARVTPLLQDYAAKTGKDLPTAAQDLGKAILGQGRALKTVGIDFTDTGTKAGNLDQIMRGLDQQVGGFAETMGDTAAGKAAILSNQFGELQEQVGAKLLPALMKLADIGLAVIDFIDGLNGPTKVAIGATAALAVSVLALSKAVGALRSVKGNLSGLVDGLKGMGGAAAAIPFAAVGAGLLAWQTESRKAQYNLEDLTDALTNTTAAGEEQSEAYVKALAVTDDLDRAVSDVADTNVKAAERMVELAESIGLPKAEIEALRQIIENKRASDVGAAQDQAAYTTELAAASEGTGELATETEGLIEYLNAHEEALQGVYDATLAQFDANLGYRQSIDQVEGSLATLATTQKEHGTDSEEYRDALLDTEDALLGQAAGAVKVWEDTTKAAGGTLNATDKTKIYRGELIKLRDGLAPGNPLRARLQAYIDQLNTIPANKKTVLTLEERRVSTGAKRNMAAGGRAYKDHAYEVGEQGRELFVPSENGTIVPSSKLGARPAAATGVNINLNIAVPPTMDAGAAGQAITEALAAYVRRNGANDLRLLLGV